MMKKRIISALLALTLTLTVLCFATPGVSATGGTATIRAGGQTYTAQVGEFIEYRVAFRHSGEKLSTAQIELPVDFSGLSGYQQEDIASHIAHIAPATADGSVILRSDGDSTIGVKGYVMNFVSSGGYSFSSEKTVLSLILCVEKAGAYDLDAKVRYVTDVNGKTIVDSNYQQKDAGFRYTETVTEAILETPAVSVATDAGGMKISWNSVPGASLYRVYGKDSGNWTKIADTKDTSYLDTNVTGGKKYTYTVRCLSKDGQRAISDYDREGKSAVYYPAPILKLTNAVDGVTVKWSATAGAEKYRLYVKNGSSWTKVTDTASTSVTDKNVASGKKYTYTIRSMDQNSKHLSWYYPDGFSITFINAPDFKVSNVENGVKISWSAVAGAEKYRVMTPSGSNWLNLADTESTSYTDKNVTSGKSYTYTVCCISKTDNSKLSAFRSGKSVKYYAAPKPRLTNDDDGVSIKWDAIAGAAKYRVYVKKNGSWTKVADTASTSLLDKNVTSGNTYTYTIRAMDSKGNHISYYYPNGVSIRFLQAPKFSLSKAADGVKISWSKVTGAAKYRVFYKGTNGWTRLSDVSGTSYIDKKVSSNKSYTYTVRCISEDGSAYTSDFRAGQSIKFYAAPKPTLSNTSKGVSLKWSAISGASKYRVYVKSSSGWTKLADTASTSYTHTAAKNGTKYTYTLRALDSKGSFLSYYYTDGFSITCKR